MPFSPEFEAKYAIQRVLGEGGMGRVYLARERGLERLVAIKFIQLAAGVADGQTERLLEEARVCASIKHPNVVRVYGHGMEGTAPFVVFEFVEGYSLAQELKAHGALPLERVSALFRGVLQGLAEAHRLAIVHRDLKPGNIHLRSDNGEPMLMDFGVAKAAAGRHVTTQAGMLLGTPAYMAPELIMGEEVTPAADVYSLGVMLFECLAGEGPFRATNDVQLLAMHVHEPVPWLASRAPHVPEIISQLVARALAKRAEERFRDARAMLTALDDVLTASGSRVILPKVETPSPTVRMEALAPTRPVSRPDAATRQVSRPSRSGLERSRAEGTPRGSRRVRNLALLAVVALAPLGLFAGALAWLMDQSVRDVRVVADDDGRLSVEWSTRHAVRAGIAVLPRAVSGSTLTSYDAAEVVQHRAALTGLAAGPYGVAVVAPDGRPMWSDTVSVPAHGAAHVHPPRDAGGPWEVTAPAGTASEGHLLVPLEGGPASVRSAGVRDGQLWFPFAFGRTGPLAGTAVVLEPRPEVRLLMTVDPARDAAGELLAALASLQPPTIAGELSHLKPFNREIELLMRGRMRPEKDARFEDMLHERLAREGVTPALAAFAPRADAFFASGEEALQRALYDRLLALEALQAIVMAQHEPVRQPVRALYRKLVDVEHRADWLSPTPSGPSAVRVIPTARFMVPDDYETWDLFGMWLMENRNAGEVAGLPNGTTAALRDACMRPVHFAGPELEKLASAATVTMRATVAFLAPGYFLRVRFRGASGTAFALHVGQPGLENWYEAMDRRRPHDVPERKGAERDGDGPIYWGQVVARFPGRLLPRGPLSVEVVNEHVPGVKILDLSYPLNRAVLVRDLTLE